MEIVVLLAIVAGLGWLLGIIGFFRAGSAHAELRVLRAEMARRMVSEAVEEFGPEMAPADAPFAPADSPGPVEAFAAAEAKREPVTARPNKPAPDLEALLTMRWGVWLGAAALLFAGIFLIRYAVEQELLGPAARCGLAALLGIALIAGAEWLRGRDVPAVAARLGRDQAPAALAAGGIAVLFGASYGAGPFYGLLPPLFSFAAMGVSSLLGLAAALRYGQLVAAIGLVGAFATPALVATDTPSMVGLFAYLTVVTAASLLVVRQTAWTWLGWAATIAGAVWIGIAAVTEAPDRWAASAFMVAAAALNLGLLPSAALDHPVGRRLAWVPFAALGTAGLMFECIVPGTLARAALFALSPIAVMKGAREPRLDRMPWIAAALGLLTLLFWALPEWTATGEVIRVEGIVEAVLPGAWAPQVIQPLITAAALFAAFHAAAGLWLERRTEQPLPWAALVAAVPVLTLAVAYAQIARFQADAEWAGGAVALAAALTGAAALAAKEHAPRRAGAHAAGAVAALALGCAMVLHDEWLTFAIALMLPALAWIEAAADLRPLRSVALAVASLVLVRLLLNWYVPSYAFGLTPVANGLVPAYAFPAASFALAAMLFRRRGDDLLVATLQAGAVALAAVFVALELRHGFGGGRLDSDVTFTEVSLHILTIAVQAYAYLHLAKRNGRIVFVWAWRIFGTVALLGAVILLFANPAFTGVFADVATLIVAYLAPAVVAIVARRDIGTVRLRGLLGGYAGVAVFVWITLQIRQFFHPGAMGLDDSPIDDAELWGWSGAWLAYGIALMTLGIRTGERALRLSALAVIALTCAKVFLVDMSGLTGLWRVLSFLGLGLVLIGLGAIQRRFVFTAAVPDAPVTEPGGDA